MDTTTDPDSFLHMMSPQATEEELSLFADLDPTDLMRQQNSSTFPFTFDSSLPKSQTLEDTSMNGTTVSPEDSTQDSISSSSGSNNRDSFESTVKAETVFGGNGIATNTWTATPGHQYTMPLQSNLESTFDIDREMANDFDFDSAASSPGAEMTGSAPFRHVAIPAEISPVSFSGYSTTNSNRGISPITNDMKFSQRHNQAFPQHTMRFMPPSSAIDVPQLSNAFGYSLDPKNMEWMQPARALPMASAHSHPRPATPLLWMDAPKATSRVEIQIPIKLALHPLPPGIKKIHLQPYTISRPKYLSKPLHKPSADTLELHASLVCSSAISNEDAYKAAFAQAEKVQMAEKRTSARKLSNGKQAETSDDENPLKGAEVWICDGCVNRERKRNDRKKSKKPEDEDLWREYEYQRIVVFNTHEVKEWEPFTTPRPDEQRHYNLKPEPPAGSMQVDLPMRIACYCRHQGEKAGFRVIFTFKTHTGETLVQAMTPPINITDDHKAATKDNIDAAHWNSQNTGVVYSGEQHNPAPFRNAHSTTDLTSLSQAFSQPTMSGFTAPFANPQKFPQQTSKTPRNMSRPGSPSAGGPNKKRKSSSNSGKLPESLKMTRIQNGGPSPMSNTEASFPGSPISMASPGQIPPFGIPGAMPYVSPDANGFGPLHRASRSQSYENLANMQAMYSAPSSAYQSRAPSPGSAGPLVTTFGNTQFSQQAMMQMMSQANSMHQASPPPQASAPVIHKVIPRQGPKAGGVEVTCVGKGFFKGLDVCFGDATATTTTFWSENTLVCLLPPASAAGKVPVTLHNSMSRRPEQQYPLAPGMKVSKFEYIDDDDVELMKRALILLGARDNGRQEDAADVARRIMSVSQSSSGSNGWSGGANGAYRQNSGMQDVATDQLDCETAVLKVLDLIDLSDSPYPARYDIKGINGQTILHLAASLGYQRLVAGLLARGANPDARDKNGMSPMHMAALNDHLKIVRRLKAAGGDTTMRSLAGWTPADMANSHATHFAIRNVSPLRNAVVSRPSTSHSTDSMLSLRPRHHRFASREYYQSEFEADSSSEDSSDEEEQPRSQPLPPQSAQEWAASRRNSGVDTPSSLLPPLLDPTNHRYMYLAAAAAAWRDQATAQWQQFQQTLNSLGLPPMALPDYQNHTNQVMRRFGSLVPQRGSRPSSSDSKERHRQNEHWWEFFTNTNSPPAYNEIYPTSSSHDLDRKTESAARAALETEADVKYATLYDNGASSSSTTVSSSSQQLSQEEEQLLVRRRKDVKGLGSDKKLFFIWIPILISLVVLMLKNELLPLMSRGVEYWSAAKNASPAPVCPAIPIVEQGRVLGIVE